MWLRWVQLTVQVEGFELLGWVKALGVFNRFGLIEVKSSANYFFPLVQID